MRRTLLVVIALALAVPAGAQAQTWSTGYFRTNDGYAQRQTLDGDPTNAVPSAQWMTTDPYGTLITNNGVVSTNGGTSIVNFVKGWSYGLSATTNGGYQSVSYGGYSANAARPVLPGITNPSLYRTFTNPGSPVTFSADFGLILPAFPGSFTNRDTFGFNFLTLNGQSSLAQIQFVPTPGTDSWYTVNWVGKTTNGSTYKSMTNLAAGSLYRLTATFAGSSFNLSMAGLSAQTNSVGTVTNYSITSIAPLISGGAIGNNLTASGFENLSVDWLLASMNVANPGANYMLINTMSVVPEPSTYALLGSAAVLLGVLVFRRRKV